MGYKILLADDSVTVQKIITLTFSDEGVDVLAVNNGDEAITRLQYMRPALIMADVSIPGKNGYEICEFVKTHPEMKNTPVILLVPAFEPFDEARARRIGADHYLTKPFQSIRTLISTVKNLIEPGSSVAPAFVGGQAKAANGAEPLAAAQAGIDDSDHVLDLDDVLSDLWAPPGQAEAVKADVPEPVEPAAAAEPGSAGEASPAEVQTVSPVIPQSVIDQIVDRVVAQLTEQLSGRLVQDLAPVVASEVDRITRERQLMEKVTYLEPEPLLELDEV